MNVEIKGIKRTKKLQQIVWIEYPVMMKILEIADEKGVAPNVVIAEIVKQVITGKSELLQPKETKPKLDIKVACPICWKLFPDLESLKQHMRKEHEKLGKTA